MPKVREFALELILVCYWVCFGALAVLDSREPGYYPPALAEKAREAALMRPIPWVDVWLAWAVLSVLTLGLFYILKFHAQRRVVLLAYCLVVIPIAGVSAFPTDSGGVAKALAAYAITSLAFAIAPRKLLLLLGKKGSQSAL